MDYVKNHRGKDEPESTPVSPDHYKRYGVEVIELTRNMPFLTGNVVKYVTRSPFKGSEVEDLMKARQYLDWAIEDAQREEA